MFCYIIFMLFVSAYGIKSAYYRQEGAKLLYANPKYVKDVTIFTSRRDRNSPYLTSVNTTTLHPWGNNISLAVEFVSIKLPTGAIKIEAKLCDFYTMNWARSWLKKYSNVPVPQCPIPAMTYHFIDVVVPPKDFPIEIIPGDYFGKIIYLHTSNKEKIMELGMTLKFQNKNGLN